MANIDRFEISRRDFDLLETSEPASITDVKTLSSYNWIEAPSSTPTIAVPGSPASWSPPAVSRKLKQDSGLVYINQNAARHPESPLEPLFRALYLSHPLFDIRSIDVVTDRNNIRKLLSYIDPSTSKNGLEAFTINIEVRKDTAIFCRDETKTSEYIGLHEFKGFGHEFEKTYTTNQVNHSTGHHRILSYRFCGLNFLVRHETDGYIEEDPSSLHKAKDQIPADLTDLLGALSLSSAGTSPSSAIPGSKLKIKEVGKEVPLASTLEIKTRTAKRLIEIREVAPQLWVSQTPKLVRAYHRGGYFPTPAVEDVSATIKKWEVSKQDELRKLAPLIRKIVVSVKKCGGKAVLKYNEENDKLVVCKAAEAKDMLPKDLYSKWNDAPNLRNETDAQSDEKKGPKTEGVPVVTIAEQIELKT